MKHHSDVTLQTNLLQAFQKNKIIQGKLNERQKSYYIDFIKEMQAYDLKTKFNRELLYAWKKESYIRQLKKNLINYEHKRFGVRDSYYESQARSLQNLIDGKQQTVVIPPTEEKRRQDVNEKLQEFLKGHSQTTTHKPRLIQSATVVPMISTTNYIEKKDFESQSTPNMKIAEIPSKIHAQSATSRKKKASPKPHRPKTTNEMHHDKIKNDMNTSSVIGAGVQISASELVNDSQKTNTTPQGIEPLLAISETLQRQTYADLIAMRSVRRPRKNPTDLKMIYEARKRIYCANKRAYEYNVYQGKCGVQSYRHFEKITLTDDENDGDANKDRIRNKN